MVGCGVAPGLSGPFSVRRGKLANAPVRVDNRVACGVTSGRWPGEKDKRRSERSVVAQSLPDPCGSVCSPPVLASPSPAVPAKFISGHKKSRKVTSCHRSVKRTRREFNNMAKSRNHPRSAQYMRGREKQILFSSGLVRTSGLLNGPLTGPRGARSEPLARSSDRGDRPTHPPLLQASYRPCVPEMGPVRHTGHSSCSANPQAISSPAQRSARAGAQTASCCYEFLGE